MNSNQLRESFLCFFEDRGHTRVRSSSLVPADPTLLFVNAGMVQFKDVFLGDEERAYNRATTSQKCMRVAGKHNDFETVGRDCTHQTFFEMLGNFSFGDYFKADAIPLAWEYLTHTLGLSPGQLYPTVYTDDDEAAAIWSQVKGIPESQVMRLGEKDNFWAMGDTGPCGPCSEIHYDRGGVCRLDGSDCDLTCECGRWIELWNLVFMQFNRDASGVMTPLPRPSIDTGLGFERLLALLQDTESNYDTDLFAPILRVVAELRGTPYVETAPEGFSYRVIADHSRATAFLIADGILPSNEGHGYVLRRVLRRAARHGHLLGFREPFMARAVAAVAEVMGDAYPELVDQADFIRRVVEQEEERFLLTLDAGTDRLLALFADLEARGERVIPGREAFKLYDTFGFPLDITADMAEERGLAVDEPAYDEAMAEQQRRARAAQRFGLDELAERYRALDLPATEFLGYETLEADAIVQAIVRDGQAGDQATAGDEVEVVLDRTPFYGEAGGQMGDAGALTAPDLRVEITDTLRPLPDLIVHRGRVTEGVLEVGQTVQATVAEGRRLDIARNHTATHLLQKALQETLGPHAQQRGSLVAQDRLRFDFTHLEAMTPEEIAAVERRVNAIVRENRPVTATITTYADAVARGAMALFGEKYGDEVRLVTVKGYSNELCGGTHLRHTGQIGFFHVVSEGGVGAGLRRIEAVTGRGAEEWVSHQLATLEAVAIALDTTPEQATVRAEALTADLRQARKEIETLQRKLARRGVDALLGQAQEVDGLRVLAARVEAADADAMREMTDWLRDKLGSAVVVLGAVVDARPLLVAAATPDAVDRGVHAGKLIRAVAQVVGGGGGGRPDMAQAGGKDASRLDEALAQVADLVAGQLN